MDNKRRFSRVRVPFDVSLTDANGACIAGSLRDVAIQGVFITCSPSFAHGTTVDVDIALHGGEEDIHVESQGEVVHREEDGLGVRFTAIDPDSVAHLRNLIAYNADDADRILDEIYEGGGLA